jgi:hypothetical protein
LPIRLELVNPEKDIDEIRGSSPVRLKWWVTATDTVLNRDLRDLLRGDEQPLKDRRAKSLTLTVTFKGVHPTTEQVHLALAGREGTVTLGRINRDALPGSVAIAPEWVTYQSEKVTVPVNRLWIARMGDDCLFVGECASIPAPQDRNAGACRDAAPSRPGEAHQLWALRLAEPRCGRKRNQYSPSGSARQTYPGWIRTAGR